VADFVGDRAEGAYTPHFLFKSAQVVDFVGVTGFTRCKSVQQSDLKAVTAVSNFGFCSPRRVSGLEGISEQPPWSASDKGELYHAIFSSPGGGGRSCVGLGIGINGNG
jgi:hypothetical protein